MSKLALSLSRGVVALFSRLDVSSETLLNGPLTHTKLTWQAPPIICDDLFNGIPLWEYFDVGLPLEEEGFYVFYHETIEQLYKNTSKVVRPSGYAAASTVLRCHGRERAYWLSLPEGFPGALAETAGAVFSLECAHLFKLSGKATLVVETDNDYWVRTKAGYEVGVRNGLPILNAGDWDADMSGLVPDLLRMPRGEPFIGCDYDLVAKLRSYLWDQRDSLTVGDFTAADYALQALRIIGMGNVTPILLALVNTLKDRPKRSARRMQVLQTCMELLESNSVSDRQKLLGLRDLMVPELIGRPAYSANIYPYGKVPPAMAGDSVMQRVRTNLEILVEKEKSNSVI